MKKIFTMCFLVQTAFTVSAQTTFPSKLQRLVINDKNVSEQNTSANINTGSLQAKDLDMNSVAGYCTPTHSNTDASNIITRVDFVGTLNDVTNSSNNNTSGYEDFTALTPLAYQEQGEAVNLNIYLYANGLFNAWVDWNRDGDFNDAGEQVYSTNGIFTNSTSFGFQVPMNQDTGNYRIRIRTANYYYYIGNSGPYYRDAYTNTNITPCGNLNDGQAEDYLFKVVTRCYARISSFEDDTKCSKTATVFNLSATGTDVTTAFNWYSAETGGTLLATSPASGTVPTGTFTTPAVKNTTTYWVTATDGTCESSTRVAVVADMRPVPTITFTPASPVRLCNGDGLNVSGKSSTETAYLINEGFENGLGAEFTVTTSNNTSLDQPWQIRTSVFTPLTTAVWRPAISSGFGANKFLSALGNALSANNMVSTVTSGAHNTNTFTSLTLQFKLYYDHYTTDNNYTSNDNITVQAYDGSTWNTLRQSGADLGKASNFVTLTYDLSGAYLNKSNVQVRFVYNAQLNLSDGVAIDSIQLYGEKPASNEYLWTQVGGVTGNCLYTDATETIPYVPGTTASHLWLKPTDEQAEDGSSLSFRTELIASNGCTADDTMVVNINDKVWIGDKGTDWSIKGNWCGNKVPVISDRVNIPVLASGGNYPVIYIGTTGKSRFLTIDSGANLVIDSGATLMIRRDLFTQIGATFTNNGTLAMQGTENGEVQNFPGPGTISEMNNLTINYTATAPADSSNVLLNAPVSIRGQLNPSSGKLSLNDNDITLKSYAAATGYVSAMGNTAGFVYNGKGRFVVERYIPARRAWRFLSTPLDSALLGTTTINEAWQEGKTNPDLNCENNQYAAAGYGTEITYNGVNGYDVNTTYNPSIKVWVNNNWATPASTYTPLNTYPAYCLFVRGDRTVCLSQGVSAVITNTVLRARGVLNEPATGGGGFSKTINGDPNSFVFVGNPYASPLDLTNVLKETRTAGINNNKFWTWNPRANGTLGVGGYIAYSNGVQVPAAETDPGYTSGAVIQSGQAFMVQLNSTSSSANLNFQQNDKSTTQTDVFGKQVKPQTHPVVYTNLLIPINNSLVLTDGVGAVFGKKFSAAVDEDDATKLWNFDENIALVRDEHRLAIEFRPMPVLADTLFYKLFLRQQPYTLQIFTQNVQGKFPTEAWLVDKYLHTQTAVNLNDTTLYNFTPNIDTNSYRNRFMLVFNKQFEANSVSVEQAVSQHDPVTVNAANSITNKTGSIEIYPNPARPGNYVTLTLYNIEDGIYNTVITDVNGKKITTGKITSEKGSSNYPVLLSSTIKPGVYNLQLISSNGILISTEKLIVAN